MLTRRFASSLAALAAAGSLAATGCSEQGAAVQVDGTSVSRSELMDTADVLAMARFGDESGDLPEWEPGAGPYGERRDSYSQEFMATAITNRVVLALVAETLDDEGIAVTDADRTSIRQQLDTLPWFGDLSAEAQDQVVEDEAMLDKLQREMSTRFEAEVGERLTAADIDLDPRYGTWDPTWTLAEGGSRSAVVPPDGPLVQGGDGAGGPLGPGGSAGDPNAPAGDPNAPAPPPAPSGDPNAPAPPPAPAPAG